MAALEVSFSSSDDAGGSTEVDDGKLANAPSRRNPGDETSDGDIAIARAARTGTTASKPRAATVAKPTTARAASTGSGSSSEDGAAGSTEAPDEDSDSEDSAPARGPVPTVAAGKAANEQSSVYAAIKPLAPRAGATHATAPSPSDELVQLVETDGGQFEINLESKGLTEVPAAVFKHKRVQVLRLAHNAIRVLPDELRTLPALQIVDIEDNALESVPALTELYEMSVLHASRNPRLGPAMESIALMDNLTHLQLDAIGLVEIPESIARLIRLRQLHLRRNALTALPTGLFKLVALMDLALDDNAIRFVPTDVRALRSLTALDLKSNQLVNLPLELGSLAPLQELMVAGNPLNPQLLRVHGNGGDTAVLNYLKRRAAGGACCSLL